MMNEKDQVKELLMKGDVERVREYLGEVFNVIFEEGRKAAHIACEYGHIDVVRLLIDSKCDMECEDDEEKRPIHYACSKGHINIVKLLIEMKCDMECEDLWKQRPIHSACLKGHVNIVKLFIEMECDMECEDYMKQKPIHFACKKGHIEIVKLLIKNKCDMECEDNDKKKPIHFACETGHLDVVKLLFQTKFDIECEGYQKRKPIHFACANGHLDIVKLLIEMKCDMECEDEDKRKPIHFACWGGHIDIVKLLIKMKCDIECENKWKRRPIFIACQNGHLDVVKLLIEKGCDFKCKDKLDLRPIHVACLSGNIELIKFLIDQKCDIECEGNTKLRPIHFACMYGHIAVVKLLIEHKCNIQCEDASNHSPIYWACVNGQNDIVDLLIKEVGHVESELKRRDIIADKMGLTCRIDCDHRSFCRESFLTHLKEERSWRQIGEGSFGNVYVPIECHLNFVLKSIQIDTESKADTKNVIEADKNYSKVIKKQSTDPVTAKNIENQINICLDSLQHENIVTYFGAMMIDNQFKIFMEYMDGGSLRNYIEKNEKQRSSKSEDYFEKIIEITKQILQGVSFLHDNKIIHRDIKPDNILMDHDEQKVKLSDFGLSSFCVHQWLDILGDLSSELSDKTYSREIKPLAIGVGTQGYIAPEIRKNEDYQFYVDIWSVGATLRHMLTGKIPPWNSYNLKINKPQGLYQLMNKMVNLEPFKRSTADALLRDAIFGGKEVNDRYIATEIEITYIQCLGHM